MHKSGIKLDTFCLYENSLPKTSALSLLLVEERVKVDGKSDKGNMKETDFVFKDSIGPQLHHFHIKKQKFGQELVSSDVSFMRAKNLSKNVEEPVSTKLKNPVTS